MNKKTIIASIILMLFMPIMFFGPDDELTCKTYLTKSVIPIMMTIAFWANYLWIVPQGVIHQRRKYIMGINVLIIVTTTLVILLWHRWDFMQRYPLMRQQDMSYILLYLACRDVVCLTLACSLGYSMKTRKHLAAMKKEQIRAEIALRDAEMAKRDAELRSLRNQISPHFLLNTLNNIYALTCISMERTQNAVLQLSNMLRHMLYDNQEEMVLLSSEANFISSYVDLMKLRLTSNVNVETYINVNENSQTKVAPLLFISLVENAFKHGIAPAKKCHITISLYEDNQSIICRITNSNHPKQHNDHSGHGIGLANVQERLNMIYPDKYSWSKGLKDNIYYSEITIKL